MSHIKLSSQSEEKKTRDEICRICDKIFSSRAYLARNYIIVYYTLVTQLMIPQLMRLFSEIF